MAEHRRNEILYKGFYPPIYDRSASVHDWYANYIRTYVERDVRQLLNIRNLVMFQKFIRLCAARSGQLLNLSSLGNECGIKHNTAMQWLSILEASYILFLLQPYYENFSKRLVKSPKLYFYDPGLASWLLGIQSPQELSVHAMRPHLFEGWILSEFFKKLFNQGERLPLYFWRDHIGNEIDLIFEKQGKIFAAELKSMETFRRRPIVLTISYRNRESFLNRM